MEDSEQLDEIIPSVQQGGKMLVFQVPVEEYDENNIAELLEVAEELLFQLIRKSRSKAFLTSALSNVSESIRYLRETND